MTAPETLSVVVERELPHPPERVWRALTQPHLIAEWLMNSDFAPVVGHRFRFRAQPQPNWSGVIDCEVMVVEPNRSLVYSWGAGEGALAMQSLVTWTLTGTAAGTHLRMEQSGFRPEQKQNYQGAKYGWQQFIGRLEPLLGRID